jgi:uncharacterized membrane protein
MMSKPKILVAGESWTVHSIHQKGFASFTTTEYTEGAGWLKAALDASGWEIAYQPSHLAARDFPATAEALGVFDCIILSDMGRTRCSFIPTRSCARRCCPTGWPQSAAMSRPAAGWSWSEAT